MGCVASWTGCAVDVVEMAFTDIPGKGVWLLGLVQKWRRAAVEIAIKKPLCRTISAQCGQNFSLLKTRLLS